MEAIDEGEPEPRGCARALTLRRETKHMQSAHDPSLSSYYVNDALYRELIDSFSDWQRDDLVIDDPGERDRLRLLVEREARLLDQLRFDEWLAMYAPQCLYWGPGTPDAGDPRREIAISFDDRRRMEDRIYRLRTGDDWSQAPKSRTVRMISNFLISEFRLDGTRFLCGWCGHRFVRNGAGWQIRFRQVNLIDCDQNLRNPSIIIERGWRRCPTPASPQGKAAIFHRLTSIFGSRGVH